MSEELKPCPFCGLGGAKAGAHKDDCYFALCAALRAAPEGDLTSVPDILAAWNRRATPPSPSTAREVDELPPLPEMDSLADIAYAQNTPDDWDADYRATWQKLQVAERNKMQWRTYALELRAALAAKLAAQEVVARAVVSPKGGVHKLAIMRESAERKMAKWLDVEVERNLYQELIFAVARKIPNESRHETALRYIREAEDRAISSASSTKKDE